MKKYSFTVGLFDKDTEKQRIESPEAKATISDILINQFDIFAFTMLDCSGVYRMQSTGAIVFEPSIRIEIATDDDLPAADIISELKAALNQETIMIEQETKDIYFL